MGHPEARGNDPKGVSSPVLSLSKERSENAAGLSAVALAKAGTLFQHSLTQIQTQLDLRSIVGI